MSKYHSNKVEWKGMKFDSKKEAIRYAELEMMQNGKVITDLQRQVHFLLIPAQKIGNQIVERKCEYVADFVYKDRDGKTVVEDVKGVKTEVYKLKKKLMLQVYGIQITET